MKDGALKGTFEVLFALASVLILAMCFPIGCIWGLIRIGFGAGNEWVETRANDLAARHIKPKRSEQ